MKIKELQELCASSPPPPCVEEDEWLGEEETEEDQLTSTLSQLENCWALLDGLEDHFKLPKAKMTTYFQREISRVATDTANLLLEYNLSGEEETD